MADDEERESLLEFPCEFAIKAMGLADEAFELLIVSIVRRHAPDMGEGAVKTKESGAGKYMSVTVTITATSQQQLDAIYGELTDAEQVILAL